MEIIKFKCGHCNCSVGVPENYAGKQVRCPKCKAPTLVPKSAGEKNTQEPGIIKFRCPNCNQKIGVTPDYAGKRVRCSKCKNPFRVPQDPGSAVKDETAVLRAGQERQPAEEGIHIGNIDELLLEEVKAPSVERQTEQGQADYGAGESDLSEYARPSPQSSSFAESKTGGDKPKKKLPIILIGAGCILVLLLVGSVLWSIFPGSSDNKSEADNRFAEVQTFAEDYIGLLSDGKLSKARELLSPELQIDSEKKNFEKLTKYLGKSKIEELRLGTKNFEEHPDGNKFYFYYSFRYENERNSIVLSVSEINKELRVDGIAVQESFGNTISIGTSSFEELQEIAMASTVAKIQSFFIRFFCGFMAVMLIVGLIQVVSIWIVFEKAGEHGWAILVPGYNMWVLAEIGGKPGWFGLLMLFSGLIPYAGIIVGLVLSFMISMGVARAFGRGAGFGVGLALVPVVFYPILAFTEN